MKWLTLIFSLLLLAQVANSEKLTAGLSPSSINLDNLMPGSEVHKTVSLTRSGPAIVKLEYDDQWVTANTTNIVDTKIKITIHVPDDATLGMHETKVMFRLKSDNDGLKPELVLPLTLNLNVTDEIYRSYKVKQAKVTDSISLVVDNQGNVEAAPDYAVVEISDDRGKIKEYRKEIDEQIKPFSQGIIGIDIEDLDNGNYWAVIKIYDDGLIRTFEAPMEITGASVGYGPITNITFILFILFILIFLVRRWSNLES